MKPRKFSRIDRWSAAIINITLLFFIKKLILTGILLFSMLKVLPIILMKAVTNIILVSIVLSPHKLN
jgi:hypothetical protein